MTDTTTALEAVEERLAQAILEGEITYPRGLEIYQDIGQFLLMTEWQVE